MDTPAEQFDTKIIDQIYELVATPHEYDTFMQQLQSQLDVLTSGKVENTTLIAQHLSRASQLVAIVTPWCAVDDGLTAELAKKHQVTLIIDSGGSIGDANMAARTRYRPGTEATVEQLPLSVAYLATADFLNEAWEWLCKRRRNYPPSADIWWLRQHWASEKRKLIQLLSSEEYQFEPLQQVTKSDGEIIELWSARDALVLKALTLVLRDAFRLSDRCTHLKGNGGSKHAVRQLQAALPEYRFVFRMDVRSYMRTYHSAAKLIKTRAQNRSLDRARSVARLAPSWILRDVQRYSRLRVNRHN